MKQTALAAILLLACVSAGQAQYVMPPPEYDHPFPGEVIVVRDPQDYPRFGLCRISHPNPIGCTRSKGKNGVCLIYIADDDTLKRYDMPYDEVLRHEIAHCNGWGGDHAGGIDVKEHRFQRELEEGRRILEELGRMPKSVGVDLSWMEKLPPHDITLPRPDPRKRP
jgi:hypothetical protein